MSMIEERAVVDRIEEGKVAVLLMGEREQELHIPVKDLPGQAGEGSWLRVHTDGNKLLWAALDVGETDAARERIAGKLERLRRRGAKRE